VANSAVVIEQTTTYHGFDLEYVSDRYVLGMEKLERSLDEVRALHQEHWDETEVLYLDEKMNPDYDLYVAKEQQATYILFTCRVVDTGELVGHLQYFIGPNPHVAGHMLASEDAFFLSKLHRGGTLAGRYIRYAEKALSQLGVKYVGMSDKAPVGGKSLEPIMRRNGYKPVATWYLKKLQES